jgi:predicted HTH domain antitoxin
MGGTSSFRLEIPDGVLDHARIPASEMEPTLKRELAVHLVARGLLPKAAARRLSGMGRIAFDDLLGERGVCSELTGADFEAEMMHLDALRGSRNALDDSGEPVPALDNPFAGR